MSTAFIRGFWIGLGKPLAWLLSWGLFWFGDLWSRLVEFVPDDWERTGEVMAQPYFWSMRASVRLNDVFGLKVWLPSSAGEPHG